MALTIDISGSSSNNTATSMTASCVTTNTNDILVICIATQSLVTQSTVSSITDNAGNLAWAARGTPLQYNGGQFNVPVNAEVWWVKWASSGSITATINFNNTFDNACASIIAINGADLTSPWDPNANSRVTATGTSSIPTTTGQSTTNTNSVLLGFMVTEQSTTTQTAGTGYTLRETAGSSGGVDRVGLGLEYKIVSSAQSSVSAAFGNSTADWAMVGDAIQAPVIDVLQAQIWM